MGLFFVLIFSAAILIVSNQRGQGAHIVGGKKSVPHSRPYMAAIGNKNFFQCGGSLIYENWVLTAAHCFPQPQMDITLGAHEQQNENELGRQSRQISKIFVYPDYNLYTFEHDIMLLKLQEKVQINEYVSTIELPTTYDDVQPETNCLVAGWGDIYFNQLPLIHSLLEVNLTVVDREICKDENHYNRSITMNMLCAGVKRGGKASCQGDSGGPLVCGEQQRGIVSSAINCAHKQYPTLFTRLTKTYISWIQKTVRDNP